VILNEDFSGYRQVLQDRIMGLIAAGTEAHRVDKPGGIFVRRSEQLVGGGRVLLQTVARVVLTDSAETLAEQVERRRRVSAARRPALRADARAAAGRSIRCPRELVFLQRLGGFTPDGREYVITLEPGTDHARALGQRARQPAHRHGVSESGGAYTWVDNAHEFRSPPGTTIR
jgi:cyclic beta-1,2-glucan synthetase